MKHRIVWITTVVMLVCLGLNPALGQEVENLLENGDFETGEVAPWTTYGGATIEVVSELEGASIPEAPIEGAYALHVVVDGPGANNWDVGLQNQNHVFENGKHYTVSFWMKSKSDELQLRIKPELQADPWTAYGESEITITEEWAEYTTTTPVLTEDVSPASITYHIGFAAGDFWVDGVRFYEGDYVAPGFLGVVAASDPVPASGQGDVARDGTVLSWEPDPLAGTHNVYVGTTYEDANNADAGNPSSVAMSLGQAENSLALGRLELGATYYWRVDEVNATPDSTVFEGAVWSFTVEPYSRRIAFENITATASSSGTANSEPSFTIDGSGLDNPDDKNALHSNGVQNVMWMSGSPEFSPWLMYEFDQVQKLDQMLIWNSNHSSEAFIGWGAKDIEIETSVDGVDWTLLAEPSQLIKGSGLTAIPAQVVDMGLIQAKFVRITILNNWGGVLPQYGLAEVQFYALPMHARLPVPTSGTVDVRPDANVSWRPGREAGQHQVYVGQDANALDLAGSVTDTSYDLSQAGLGLDETYYWRVDEVNDADVWTGPVWSLSTSAFLVVEDFESYTNFTPNRPFQTWLDGFGYSADEFFPVTYEGNGTGAGIGHDIWSVSSPHFDGSIMERDNTIAGSNQAMPFYYSNAGGVASQTERTLAEPQDWTLGGVQTLSIPFNGQTGNTGTLFIMINNDKITYQRDSGNISHGGWQAWNIDLATVNTTLSSVTKITLGVEGSGAEGMLLFDDLRLYPEASELITPADPGGSGLIAQYTFEGNANDVSGNGNNGTLEGNPGFSAGVVGTALDCDGLDDYVSTGKLASQLGIGGNSPRTVSSWVYTNGFQNGGIYDVGGRADGQDFSLRTLDTDNNWRVQYWGGGDADFTLASLGTWVHFTHVHDGVSTQVYANGLLISSHDVTLDTTDDNPFQIGLYGWPDAYFWGLIDEVRVYNRALSAGEALWLAGITNPIDKPF